MHLSDLRHNRHHSRHLQRAWNKYGAAAFEWVLVEETSPVGTLAREQFYLDAAFGAGEPLFNIRLRADSPLGTKHSPASRRRQSKRKKEHFAADPGAMARAVEHMRQVQAISIAQRKAATHCKRGHEFTPENTYYRKCGRGCKACHRASRRRRRGQKLDNLFAAVGRKVVTHCKRGHPLSGDNIVEVCGQRYCRTCREMRIAERTVRRRKLRAA